MRLAASPGAAQSLSEANAQIDVRHVLGSVHVPSLIIHAPDRADVARYVADKLPYAEVVEEDEAKFERIEEFLGKAHEDWNLRGPEPARVLATVLFTDLVASTSRAVELGPGWRELLRQHNAVIRRELARHAGREIDRAGDGFFASGFDGPARAIRCACAIRDAVRGLGLGVRLGVHTGECDLVDGKLAGLGVVIGSRVAAEARDGEVLVSGTVKDLVAGSGIEFEPRGAHELKGLGDWPLYAVVAT
jgi:class 3 adenylate cyclase